MPSRLSFRHGRTLICSQARLCSKVGDSTVANVYIHGYLNSVACAIRSHVEAAVPRLSYQLHASLSLCCTADWISGGS
eukprot:SAG31_NODE_4007_length_3670_cov_1.628955_4_plen_78_part_00